MGENRFFERIDEIEDIGILSELVCREYGLGDYLDTNLGCYLEYKMQYVYLILLMKLLWAMI
jgi:hypothetical protein